ncbi:MAG: glycyl radical protein [Ignavibacteriales bacterium]|nr:glycyl radical protein [Ignavibacteriales bacterium]
MNDRVKKLREQSINSVPTISSERAKLVTNFYKNSESLPIPIQRALVFKTIMENKTICINHGELIVGERGPAPKATYTYLEICCHMLSDLETLHNREKVWFKVDEETRRLYRDEFIPFWKEKTIREKIFNAVSDEWKDAYSAGIFTEFMEQRAPGHTVLDDKIYRKGMLDLKNDIEQSLKSIDFKNDPEAKSKENELQAMNICADAIISFANRHADKVHELAFVEINPVRKSELEAIEKICRRVPANAPQNFWEALQYYWFIHLGVVTELNPWDAFNPGHLDRHLYPFYKKGLENETLTKEKAKELLQCFWVKFNNQPAPPKVGVTAAESSTYTDFANINSGGIMSDGSDGVNELTYLILDVIDEMKLVQPSSNIQLSEKNSDEFLKHALKIIKNGRGQPSIFNADTVVDEMLRQGKSIEDARNGGTSGCVETGAFGKESYILTGYFNIPKVFEITLNNGVDPRTGRKIGLETGNPELFKSFDELMFAFEKQMKHFIDIKMKGNHSIERLYAEELPVPFLSILIDDCILKGKDYNKGGTRYNTNYIQGVGIGTITDCLASIKYNVFEKKIISMTDMLKMLAVNFERFEREQMLLLNKTPKYGNDDDYADDLMKQVFEMYFKLVDGRPNTKGGLYRINLLPTTCHIYFGSVTGATPDGRKAWTPLSEGISPVQGADRKGPTAVLKSAGKMDHVRTGGTLLNQKFTPQILESEKGLDSLAHLVRGYFIMGGHHIQFNVVTAQTLREAQAHPEQHRDLIVRVAGYSDYFCDLSKTLQDEIIARTEHQGF